MRKFLICGLILFSYLSYGIYLGYYNLAITPRELNPEHPPGYYDYRGITHCHSDRSGGGRSPEEIIRAAQISNIDFLFLTDLNDFKKPYDLEGYHDKLLVSVAGEYTYLDSHVLFYDVLKPRHLEGLGQSQVLFADLLSQPGLSEPGPLVLAHPFKPGHAWSGPYPAGLKGIEVINLRTIWQKAWPNNRLSFFWSFLIFPFNTRLALLRLYENPLKEIQLWDKLSQGRHTIGLVGNDTSSRVAKILGMSFEFPSYNASFDIASNHVLLKSELTGDALNDRRKIMQALTDGQFYMSLDILADPRGFLAEVQSADGKTFPMGSEISWQPNMSLYIRLRRKPTVNFEIAVYKDGLHIASSNSQETSFNLHTPGIYRVMVRVIPTLPLPDGKKWLPWIYSNPFFVRPSS